MQVGLSTLAANRSDMPTLTGFVGRVQRAHRNTIENLVLFAALVLVVVVAQKSNNMALMGAQQFFWAWLVCVVVYGAGIPWLRTDGRAVSVAGMVMAFNQLV